MRIGLLHLAMESPWKLLPEFLFRVVCKILVWFIALSPRTIVHLVEIGGLLSAEAIEGDRKLMVDASIANG